jgi:hypothetical protein
VPLVLLDSGGISGKDNIVAPAGMVLGNPAGCSGIPQDHD